MTTRTITALCLVALLGSGAMAQPADGPVDRVPTKFAPLADSLESLLNNGYEITTAAMGVFILSKRASGHSLWAFCSLDVAMGLTTGAPGNYRPPTSTCFALN